MAKILLLGYFGAGNFGDDALLVDWLKRRRDWLVQQDLQVDVITRGRDLLGGFTDGNSLKELVATEIAKDDALKLNPKEYTAMIAPGGSLLQDVTSLRSLIYYLLLIRRFNAAKVPVYMLNQGIGPLNSWVASVFTPRQLAGVKMLSLRDRDSHDYCLRNGFLSSHRGLVHSADPVIAARFDPPEQSNDGYIPDEPYALVIPKPTGDLPTPIDPIEESAALAVMLEHCIEATELSMSLLPFHPSQDLQMCLATRAALNNRATVAVLPEGTAHQYSHAWQLISGASLVISYRLHGLVCAAANGIPAMGVAYDPKVSSLCNELGLPYCFPATVHEMDSLDDLRRLWNSRLSVIDHVNTEREKMLLRLKEAEQRFDELW